MIIARLEEAGMALLSMQISGTRPAGYRPVWPVVVQAAVEAYGYSETRVRPACPDAHTITRMDEALSWISLIPADKYVLRRIVGARALLSPRTHRHLYSWMRLAQVLGADRRAVRRWYQEGVEIIQKALTGATVEQDHVKGKIMP